MNRISLVVVALLIATSILAQSPQKISYQAVIRDSDNHLVASSTVGMQISILQGSVDGSPVYVETQIPTTNSNGLVSIEIGTGTTSDDFSAIDWSDGPYFLKFETDPSGGTDYSISGTTQLLSVPYALHSKTAESITGTITESDPVFTAWDKDYEDLGNKPSIIDTVVAVIDTTTQFIRSIEGLATQSALEDTAQNIREDLFAGDYSDLKNTPDIADTVISVLDTTTQFVRSGHYIGELHGGGIVFWVSPDLEHGLVASLVDVGFNRPWSANTTTGVGELAQGLNDGAINTAAIVALNNTPNYAATLCDSYEGGGFIDWYLPAIRELNLLISQDYVISYVLANDSDPNTNELDLSNYSVHNGKYWSSTELGSSTAYLYKQTHDGGTSTNYSGKNTRSNVRAIRKF